MAPRLIWRRSPWLATVDPIGPGRSPCATTTHDHDDPAVGDGARTAGPSPSTQSVMKAVAAGRPDVLGTSGMLGLQRAAGNRRGGRRRGGGRSPVHDVVSGGGAPLDEDTRTDMEARMGQDFSDVRVHTGDAADASARSVSAHAYTVGSNIVFQRGGYEPGSVGGPEAARPRAHPRRPAAQRAGRRHAGRRRRLRQRPVRPVRGRGRGQRRAGDEPARRRSRPAQASAPAGAGRTTTRAPRRTAGGRGGEEEEVQAAHDPALGPVQRQEEEEEPEEA